MKVIFIEGLPGSGKSTFARKLKEYYQSLGKKVAMYNEGDLHPIDLAWCSITDSTVFYNLLLKYKKYDDQILSLTKKVKGKYITAYTKVRLDDEDASFYDEFAKYEIYRVDNLQEFLDAHLELWSSFHSEDMIYIFECIFLQNHINELILKYNKDQQFINQYFNRLLSALQTKPTLFYIKQLNIDQTLNRIIEERRSDNPVYKDWIELVKEYFETTTFGNELGYITEDGVVQYFKDRQNMELEVIDSVSIEKHVFELEDDYDSVFEEMKKVSLD